MPTLTIREEYDFALTAWKSIVYGGAVRVYVDQNGERIEYNAGSANELLKWIRTLAALLPADPGGLFQPTRPLRPYF